MAAVPDGEEHSLENFCRRAVDCDAVVLPVAVGGGDICVLVGEVDSARECDLAVDRDDFAVVADIQLGEGEGGDAAEYLDLCTRVPEGFEVALFYFERRAQTVDDDFDPRAVGCGAFDCRKKRGEDMPAGNYEKFDIHAVLGAFDFA